MPVESGSFGLSLGAELPDVAVIVHAFPDRLEAAYYPMQGSPVADFRAPMSASWSAGCASMQCHARRRDPHSRRSRPPRPRHARGRAGTGPAAFEVDCDGAPANTISARVCSADDVVGAMAVLDQ
ncbi:MAG: hypothetical protein HYV09_29485 [Deltaproteobacteria bacterium]|nr:hypothetical protein [Deltaproteobacteria bacterium]